MQPQRQIRRGNLEAGKVTIAHSIARLSTSSVDMRDSVTLPEIPGVEVTHDRRETAPRQPLLRVSGPVVFVGVVADEQQRRAVDRLAKAISRAREGAIKPVTDILGDQ